MKNQAHNTVSTKCYDTLPQVAGRITNHNHYVVVTKYDVTMFLNQLKCILPLCNIYFCVNSDAIKEVKDTQNANIVA